MIRGSAAVVCIRWCIQLSQTFNIMWLSQLKHVHCRRPRRRVLGVLPAMRLRLPDDPPALLHDVSCLLEVVAPGNSADAAKEVGEGAEVEGDSEDSRPTPAKTRLRLTVFAAGEHVMSAGVNLSVLFAFHPAALTAVVSRKIRTACCAAGALACWYEAPVTQWNNLEFTALNTAPNWSTNR